MKSISRPPSTMTPVAVVPSLKESVKVQSEFALRIRIRVAGKMVRGWCSALAIVKPEMVVAGSASARVRRPLSPMRLHKRYDISGPFFISSFVVALRQP